MIAFKKFKDMLSASARFMQNKHNFVSPIVISAFKIKYPNATAVQWQQIDVSRWHVDFVLRKMRYSSLFDSQGNWLETINSIPAEAIPEVVLKNFEKNFEKDGIGNIRQVETTNRTLYEIKCTNGIFIWNLIYDVSGKMIGKLIS